MMKNLERIIGKKSHPFSRDALLEKISVYEKVHIDLGTGDGLFVWRLAREEGMEKTLVIGLDASRESLAKASARCVKKPARGGASNAIFFCANVLEMGDVFDGLADTVSINFPWGSLLQASALPFDDAVENFSKLVKENGILDVHINLHVFKDEEQRRSLGLVDLDESYLINKLLPAYEKHGFVCLSHSFIPSGQEVPVASTWGGRLTKKSGRPTLSFKLQKKSALK